MEQEQKQKQKRPRMVVQSSSMADLPLHILIEIISRLPIKTVMVIRCVCKSLLSVVSDSHFQVLHSTRAPTELFYSVSGESSMTFCMAEYVLVDGSFTAVDAKLNVAFELPRFSVTSANYCNLAATSSGVTFVNSCCGLVCYSGPPGNMFAVICNPFTREYVTFPCPMRTDKTVDKTQRINYGLGFSPKDNRFKLLRRFYRKVVGTDYHDKRNGWVVEIYTFGERGSPWKTVANLSNEYTLGGYHDLYHEGALHRSEGSCIVTFNFDTELFGKLVTPPGSRVSSIGVFENCLYTTNDVGDFGCIWVMKEYGQDPWVKIFSIKKDAKGLWDRYEPFKYLRNGQVLMFKNRRDICCFKPDSGSNKYVSELCHRHGAVSIRPSLVSLKVSLGDNVKVHSVKPWDCNKVASTPRTWASSVVIKDLVKAMKDPQGSSTPSSSEALASTFHPTKEKVKENVIPALQQGDAEVGNSGSKDLMPSEDRRLDYIASGIQKLVDEIKTLKAENERKSKAIDTLNAENERKGKANDTLNAENERKGKAIDTLNAENKRKGKANDTLNAENERKGKAIDTLNAENKLKVKEIDTLNAENERKGKAIETLHLEIDRQGKKIAKLKQRKKMDRALVRIMLQQMLNATPNMHEDDSSSSDDSN